MLDFLFGEGQYGIKLASGLIILIALSAALFWGLRGLKGDRPAIAKGRGRQPRLAVIDAATVDGRRRLVLIRRDGVEHLLMIGGPGDVVVEANIVAATDTLPRPVERAPTSRPEPPSGREPAARVEPPPRPEPAPRPQRPPPASGGQGMTASSWAGRRSLPRSRLRSRPPCAERIAQACA